MGRLKRADPLNPQPLPPGPSQMGRLKRADPLNPQPLPPGPSQIRQQQLAR